MEMPTPSVSTPMPGIDGASAGLWRHIFRLLRGPFPMALMLFVFSLVLDTRHNDFPYTYHPDERGKALQITESSRNYHHPLLMLSVTDWAMRIGGIDRTPQAAAVAGRWVSAAFAAGTVAAFAAIAWLRYGAVAGWVAGAVLALQIDLFKTAHYMKEDPGLMFGLALALLAAHLWRQWPGRRTLLFLAIACGIAVSGKYVGFVTLIFAVPLVFYGQGYERPLKARLKLFAIAFFGTFLLANTPLLVRPLGLSNPFRSIKNEVGGATGGHHGLSRKVPHAIYVPKLKSATPPPVAILAAAYAMALAATARRRSSVEWLNFLFPLVFLAMLSCSPKIADRYLLPVSVSFAFLSALGAAEIARFIDAPDSRPRQAAAVAALIACAAWLVTAELPPFREAYAEYATDDHKLLADWVRAQLPADAVLAEDHRVNLSASKAEGLSNDARVPQRVFDADFAADLGTLDELRRKGVTHVAVCRDTYNRFFEQSMKPGKAEKSNYERRKAFYAELFARGELLQEWPAGKVVYLHPGMKLYRLPPATDSEPGQ